MLAQKRKPLKIWWCKFSKRNISVRLLNSSEFCTSECISDRQETKQNDNHDNADLFSPGRWHKVRTNRDTRLQCVAESSVLRREIRKEIGIAAVTVGALAVSVHITVRLRNPTRYNTDLGLKRWPWRQYDTYSKYVIYVSYSSSCSEEYSIGITRESTG